MDKSSERTSLTNNLQNKDPKIQWSDIRLLGGYGWSLVLPRDFKSLFELFLSLYVIGRGVGVDL